MTGIDVSINIKAVDPPVDAPGVKSSGVSVKMTAPTAAASNEKKRKLRTHNKSRAGCRNCKIRKVKCDESKPECKRCRSYGVSCSYGSTSHWEPDLQIQAESLVGVRVLSLQRCSSTKAMLGMINKTIDTCDYSNTNSFGAFKFEIEDLNRLERFQTRTVISMGTPITGKVYQDQVIKLICQHPYLLHAVMTVTSMHDRHMSNSSRTAPSLTESYHYGQAASLFRRKLASSIHPSEHDGLWATCAILGTIAFFAFDALTPDQAWPLKSSPTDLEWLEILDGIHAVWAIVRPTRRGSAFEKLSEDKSKAYLLSGRSVELRESLDTIPQAFVSLCELDNPSNHVNNPYHNALHTLAPLLDMTCNQNTFLCFLAFTGFMDTGFKNLLHEKDPRALLIMSYWFAKLCHVAPWFMSSRALIECQAICMYLERYHAYHKPIQELLHFPKMECGLSKLPLTPISIEG